MRSVGIIGFALGIVTAMACGSPMPDDTAGPRNRQTGETGGTGGSGSGFGGRPTTPPPGFGGSAGTGVPPRPPGTADAGNFDGGIFDEPLEIADRSLAPISGGTLMTDAEGRRAVVADPDRDIVVAVDMESMTIVSTTQLSRGDEPGRLTLDATGLVHVVLRGGGGVATIDPVAGIEIRRVRTCRHPRGVAYDAHTDEVHVACAGGELVSYNAEAGTLTRKLDLDRDLRDVVVDGDHLLVSRFRSAELLVIDAAGAVSARLKPLPAPIEPPIFPDGGPVLPPAEGGPVPPFTDAGPSKGFPPPPPPDAGPIVPPVPPSRIPQFAVAAVAWRTIPAPGGGAIMAYQMLQTGEVGVRPGGYGGGCQRIVDTGVSWIRREGLRWVVMNVPAVLPVDVGITADGSVVGVASAAWTPKNFLGLRPYAVFAAPKIEPGTIGPATAGRCQFPFPPGFTPPPDGNPIPPGRVVSLAFHPTGQLILQTREPAMLIVGHRSVSLSDERRVDTGHELFHLGTAGGIACASCHPEGHEDGHVWRFAGLGPRRTQSISGGILGTEPFHWNGDMGNFHVLAKDVFISRMSGPAVQPAYVDALAAWINDIPRLSPPAPADEAAALRGKAIFDDPVSGCATCHAGPRMTNNATVDVWTGGPLQVPSLLGLAYRAPYMHQGCAPTLADRFGPCGGGDAHGHTSHFTKEQVADLVAYLGSL